VVLEHPEFVVLRGVVDDDLEQETVELRFGQRVGPLLLDGILGRQHHEGIGQLEGRVTDGDLSLLHGLEQRRLHLRRRTVDLVGEHQVGEDRALVRHELRGLGIEDHGPGDVGRQQVGRELQALEPSLEGARQGAHGEGLGETRDALEQNVAPAHQRHHHRLDQFVLPHHHVGDGALNLAQAGRGRIN
jgi:hypothetical protein